MQKDINSEIKELLKKSLPEISNKVSNMESSMPAINDLKSMMEKIERLLMEARSLTAAKKITEMTEEERRMLLMWPDERKFYLEYKNKNPQDPWSYYTEYIKKVKE